MEKIRLEIIGMSYSQSQSGAYALILGEKDGKRRLPIIIGGFEAQSIAIELEKIKTPRPLTHDLFKTVLDDLSVTLDRVEITKLHEGTFYAEIELDRGGAKSRISSRPSDAIALAVRFGGDIPIFADEDVLDEAGVLFEADDEEQEVAQFRQFLDEVTPEDFAQ